MAGDGIPQLSMNATAFLHDLRVRAGEPQDALDWLAALLEIDRSRAVAAAGTGLAALESAARREPATGPRGVPLGEIDVAHLAGHAAAAAGRPVATPDDVALAIVAAAGEAAGAAIRSAAPDTPAETAGTAGGPGPFSDLAGTGRTFRLFVSSTFSDLQEERNALHREVFPVLQEECARHGARFQAIDLRWGVSAEAGLDQKTMPLCLAEIERCQRTDRPNFIVLLGDRYGWMPLPATIPEHEFDAIAAGASPDQQAVLEEWYLRDDNAVPPEYYLKPRTADGPYGASPEGEGAWQRMELQLGTILRTIVPALGFPDEARVKYEVSATGQEIAQGALAIPDAADHVFCFFRTVDGLPHTAASARYEDIREGGCDEEAARRLAELKDRLRAHVPDNVAEYRAGWVGDAAGGAVTTGHLPALCADVRDRLLDAIRSRFDAAGARRVLDSEIDAHRRFAAEHARVFVGRAGPLAAIAGYLAAPGGKLLIVGGPSGSGKTALLARATADVAEPVVRFAGATARSSELRSLLTDLCRQIGERYGAEAPVPDDVRELIAEFERRLGLATPDRPLVVLLDAADQVTTGGFAAGWLPTVLPEHVALVATATTGEATARFSQTGAHSVEVSPMPPEEGRRLLAEWLAGAGRTLQPGQEAEVLNGFARSGLPLYLKLAFEEARRWRSTGGHHPLAGDVPGVIRENLFNRLDDPDHHGEVLVSRTLGYLAASRFGLAEDELLRVLARDETVMAWIRTESARTRQQLPEQGEPQLPVVLWSRLFADLEPYLTERIVEGATLLTFYHAQFGDIARQTYLGDDAALQRHAALAGYFRSRIDPAGDGSWSGADVRGLAELPFHLVEAADEDGAEAVLTDFTFLERKAAEVGVVDRSGPSGGTQRHYSGVYRLIEDLDHALSRRRAGA